VKTFVVLAAALVFVGSASAYALRTVMLKPGQCVTVSKTRVCAARTPTVTVSVTPAACTAAVNDAKQLDTIHWQILGQASRILETVQPTIQDIQNGNTSDLAQQNQTVQDAGNQTTTLTASYKQAESQFNTDAAGC
jgi:hypothetical protein